MRRSVPGNCKQITEAATAQDHERVNALSAHLEPLWALFRKHGGSIRVIAAAAGVLGLTDTDCLPSITSTLDNLSHNTLIVCGYSSEVGVLLTALSGLRQGYNVFIPVDCIGSRSLRTETAVLRQAEKAGAVITSLATLAAQLAPDFSKEPGRTMLSVISNIKC